MLLEFSQALTSLKNLSDLVTLLSTIRTGAAVRERAAELTATIIELQTTIMTIRAQYQALARAHDDLEQQRVELEQWHLEAERYRLHDLAAGVFVYALKAIEPPAEPAHWLCAYCYQQRQKAILQRKETTGKGTVYFCPGCKTEIVDHSERRPFTFA